MADTTVWGCGAANYANGAGSPETTFAPKLATAIQSAGPYICVSAGNQLSFGVDANNKLYTWGEDAHTATHVTSVNFPVRAVVQHAEMPYGCLLGVDGSVWSWGKSDDFLTGLATELPVTLKNGPYRLEGFDSRVIKVSLGAKHGAALTEKGSVYTWGTGLGIGIAPTSPMPYHASPEKVKLPSAATDIAVGDGFTLACMEDGTAQVWGELAESEEWQPKPVSFLASPGKIISVAAGDRHAAVLTDSGSVFIWGSNDNRELGNGEVAPKKAPFKLPLTNIVSVKLFKNSCFAIDDKGDIHTWGSNVWGHLGLGHINPVTQPTLITALSAVDGGGQVKVVDVTMGFNHTLFSVAPRGSSTPIAPATFPLPPPHQPYPPTAPASEDAPKGQLWTTGSITATGNEPSEEVMIWRKAPQFEGKTIIGGATANRAAWAIYNDELFAWGSGNLGTGDDMQNATNPSKLWDLDGRRITNIHVGPSGDWAMAITDKGQVYAWGEGTDFRTGLGNTARASFPKNVEFPSPVKRLALGHSHGIAVTQDYGVFTWGAGKALGTAGRTTIERSPKRMPNSEFLGVCDVAAGRNFSMFLTLDGEVFSWGDPADGKLGHGDESTELLSPTLITAFDGIKIIRIDSGLQYSLALADDGSVYSWGYGADGYLGFGSGDLTSKSTPQKIPFFEAAGKMANLVATPAAAFVISETCGLYAWGTPHLGVGTGRAIAMPARVASLQRHAVQGVAPGEWQSIAWVGPKTSPPPLAPGRMAPWGPVPTAEVPEIEEPEPEPAVVKAKPLPPVPGEVREPPAPAPQPANPSPASSPSVSRVASKLNVQQRLSVGPAPPDKTKFGLHTKALEQVPSIHKFFPDEPEVDKLAQLGNIEEVRKFLDDKGWEPSNTAHAEAIKICAGQVKKDEIIVKGWVLYSINKQDFENERILVVSDRAHYRFKFDFKKKTILQTKRFAAKDVYQVLCGKFKDVSKVSGKLRGDAYEKQCGFQVWFSDPAEWKPPSVILPFQKIKVPYTIYRPSMGADSTFLQQERVCFEIMLALEATVHYYRNGSTPIEYLHEFMIEAPKRFDGFPAFPCRKVALIPRAPLTLSTGILSVAHNKWLTPKK